MKLTEKQNRFFEENAQLRTPYLLVDLDVVEDQFRQLEAALPLARCYYAVKCNPAPAVIRKLKTLGARFEAASISEIELCLEQGVDVADIHFGNTIKSSEAIREAHNRGVHSFTVDSRMELLKLARHAPAAKVSFRLETDGRGATFGLDRKFGASSDALFELIVEAADLGLRPYGISFHVGSQQLDPNAWVRTMEPVAELFERVERQGINLELVNLGGGFPSPRTPPVVSQGRSETPPIHAYGEVIEQTARRLFPPHTHFVIEPGRFLTADAGVLRSSVVLVAERGSGKDCYTWVFLDGGRFNGLHDAGVVRFPMLTSRDAERRRQPMVLAGPTCDSDDILYDETVPVMLPSSLDEGDTVDFLGTGAYTTTFSTVGFNGFPALAEYYI